MERAGNVWSVFFKGIAIRAQFLHYPPFKILSMSASLTARLEITSPAFKNGSQIPMKYTCDGEAVNPPLAIAEIPQGTQSLALIVEDPDAPRGTYDHWLVWNISPASVIVENSNPGISGNNSGEMTGYHAPCPPEGSHRYRFHVFALNTDLDLEAGSKKAQMKKAMKGHILAKGTLLGMYEREISDK